MGLASHSTSSNARAGRDVQPYRVMENKTMKSLFFYVVAPQRGAPRFAGLVCNPS